MSDVPPPVFGAPLLLASEKCGLFEDRGIERHVVAPFPSAACKFDRPCEVMPSQDSHKAPNIAWSNDSINMVIHGSIWAQSSTLQQWRVSLPHDSSQHGVVTPRAEEDIAGVDIMLSHATAIAKGTPNPVDADPEGSGRAVSSQQEVLDRGITAICCFPQLFFGGLMSQRFILLSSTLG